MADEPDAPKSISFAGGVGTHSVLSTLNGAHSIGEGFLGFLTMVESNALRSVCVEFREAVIDFPWMDAKSVIKGSVEAWRAAFPAARAVNVSEMNKDGKADDFPVGRRKHIVDADFVHIRGDARAQLHTVNMTLCLTVTDAAFVHLRGIDTLSMWGCNQATITDAAFVHLTGIQSLSMTGCRQITDAAFKNLCGIQKLNMAFCDQATDAAFGHLRGIKSLNIFGCYQATITDAAFVHLSGIQELYMSGCDQETITDAAFEHLQGIQVLYMSGCNQATITDEAIAQLVGIRTLNTGGLRRDVRVAAAKLIGVEYESEDDAEEDEDDEDGDEDDENGDVGDEDGDLRERQHY